MSARHVRPKVRADRADVSAALAAGWGRAAFVHGKGALADGVGITPRCVNRALTGETTPELVAAVNSLLVDPTALDEVLALVGFRAVPLDAIAADDLTLVVGLTGAGADYVERLADGRIDHVDEAALARRFRQLIGPMEAVIARAAARAGGAA